MKKYFIKKTKEEICSTHPVKNLLDNWFFKIDEVSNNHYVAEGTDSLGHKVSAEGSNYQETINKVVTYAKSLNKIKPGPKTIKLIKKLSAIIKILENENENHWINILKKSKLELLDSDFNGIIRLEKCYGGMGSFSDLYIEKKYNKFNKLQNDVYNLVIMIKKDKIEI